ncbi:MAG: FAD-binding oxidoreductase [Bacteroidia bacterium]|nr:FAD-binding oxidoreductase [Bacteroidia bacterium]
MMKYPIFFLLLIIFNSCHDRKAPPVVIIGGGLMGSSAAWQLANAGEDVLLLEQQDSNYEYGSSLGEARIARSLGPKNDKWSYLHNLTVEEVKVLIDFLNNKSTDQHHISDIYRTSPMTYVRHLRQLNRIEAIMHPEQQDSFQFARTPEEALAKFGMVIPDTTIVIKEYKEHTGTINPQKLIQYTHMAIRLLGQEVQYDSKVTNITRIEDGFEVTYSDKKSGDNLQVKAKKLISAAGPWTGPLLSEVASYMDTLINPQRVFLSFLRINPERYKDLNATEKAHIMDGYPLINSSRGTRMGSNFSMIEKIGSDGIPVIKIGGHFQRSNIDNLQSIWQKKLSQSEIDWSMSQVLQYLNMQRIDIDAADIELVDGYSCVYSLTRTEVPFVSYGIKTDTSPDKDLVIMAGLSGVGGKGSLAYGKMAAFLVLEDVPSDQQLRAVMDFLSLQRILNVY